MKLKNVLILAFLVLTVVPASVVIVLLYQSGLQLSRESYIQNLIESVNVQADYISQALENNMVYDSRFAGRNSAAFTGEEDRAALLTAFDGYLSVSEDKVTACFWFDKEDNALYTIGETAVLETVRAQLPERSARTVQQVLEFQLKNGVWSLGVVTPVTDEAGAYAGCLVSVYDKAYLQKIISSYYRLSDTSVYICRESGEILSARSTGKNEEENLFLNRFADSAGELHFTAEGRTVSGYYKNIQNTSWVLAGVLDDGLVYAFTNRFVVVYALIIFAVVLAAVVFALFVSRRVAAPINSLVKVMEEYRDRVDPQMLAALEQEGGYSEVRSLRGRFAEMLRRIQLVQHNFEGMYELYQSGDMEDTNIDIDVIAQTVQSNKPAFQALMDDLEVRPGACIVERFSGCFGEKDGALLMGLFEEMRDKHLSVPREAEVYTPYLGQKWFHILIAPLYSGERLSRLFVQLRDVTGFKKQELAASEKARRDPLTGLFNRTGLVAYAENALQNSGPQDTNGLLFVDMDHFKMVNDTLGHGAGDKLLCDVGAVLQKSVEGRGIAARLGGDEFAVFLPRTSEGAMDMIQDTLHNQLTFRFEADKAAFDVTASLGLSLWEGGDGKLFATMLQEADAAMYREKRAKRT